MRTALILICWLISVFYVGVWTFNIGQQIAYLKFCEDLETKGYFQGKHPHSYIDGKSDVSTVPCVDDEGNTFLVHVYRNGSCIYIPEVKDYSPKIEVER